ncbi:hypothetical protein [Micromonospora sp. NPDC126480]|uniref:hypothetical protein n=1 Tax=Micromonospora sp. NPDC126480 TaxID=3155312 RepID=UPI00332A92D7
MANNGSARSISGRVSEMLADPKLDEEGLRLYLARLLDQASYHSRLINKQLVLFFGIGALFEVLSRGAVRELELLGAKFQDLSFIRSLLPVAAAYLFASMVSSFLATLLYRRVVNQIHFQRYPRMAASRLHELLLPVGNPFSITMELDLFTSRPSVQGLMAAGSVAYVGLIFAGPVAFFVYAYSRLFAEPGAPSVLVYLSLLGTVFFALFALWQIAVSLRLD